VTAAYLAKLNPQQRRAMEHGLGITNDGLANPPRFFRFGVAFGGVADIKRATA
jgi:hypothetical protein